MFDVRWAKPQEWSEQPAASADGPSALDRNDVARALHVVWQEHCVECAVPDCYRTCALYEARADGNCARFKYGIYPNPGFSGQFEFGADIHFRRWAKLEAALGPASASIPIVPHGLEQQFSQLPLWIQNRSARVLHALSGGPLDFDAFVIECHNPSAAAVTLILTYDIYEHDRQRTLFRESFTIAPGRNFFSVPFGRFSMTSPSGFLRLYLDDADGEARLIFSWLDFVKFKPGHDPSTARAAAVSPAAKVKCVAWDLDNTLWRGTLVETQPTASLTLAPGVMDLIRGLDARGIIQTIVSRNDHPQAWAEIERLGLADYFIAPAINWGQKSGNLRTVAERINLGLDTFALIDDSPQQRHEVALALPQVRVYADTDIPQLLTRPEFNVPITEASASRRLSYLASMRREEVQATFDGRYEDFLRACEMQLQFFRPQSDAEILRCWELVQRTNQLNLSGRRYTLEEFTAHLRDADTAGCGIRYQDKFGDYGIVGFVSVRLAPAPPALVDFVLSCRVAQQRVEHAFLIWLSSQLRTRGADSLRVHLRKTARNGPLQQVFADLPFTVVAETAEQIDMTLDLSHPLPPQDLARVSAEALD